MPLEILEFLKSKRTGVIALKMLDGTVHAATVHFSQIENPLTFIFLTTPGYRKLEPLQKNAKTSAAFVIGTEEGTPQQTFQLDGEAALADTPEIRAAYFGKFPEKEGRNPNDVFFTFTPTWWRFTKWEPQAKTVITSDGNVVITPKS